MKYKTSNKSKILKYYYLFFISVFAFSLLLSATTVKAVTPTFSLSALGDGDSVQLNVSGDANTNVLLYYTKSGYGQQITPIGYTNANGILTTTISSSNYGIVSNSPAHVTLGSINGPQSNELVWPNVSATISASNMLTLSQTGLVLAVGQTATISASNLNSNILYLSSNSKPVIANVNISGNQITVLANSYGSTTATVCLVNNASNCGSVYITVQNTSASPLTFSQNSVSMYSGQTISVGITGGSGSYNVLSNSSQNQGIVQASISGSTLTLSTNSTTGSSTITVCSNNMVSCGIINVTIGANNSTVSTVTFSQSNPTLSVGQNLNVSVYGPSNSIFYVASNSGPNIVQANLSGSTLTLLGITNGSSNVQVCASTSICGTINVAVNYGSGNTGEKLTLSQDSISVNVGQTATVTISGGAMPYNISYTPNIIFQPTLNVNVLSIYGTSAGSSLMNVCSYAGNCATLSIAVNSPNTIVNLPTGCTSASGYSPITGLSCSSVTGSAPSADLGCTGSNIYSTITGQRCPIASANSSAGVNSSASATSSSSSAGTYKFTKALKLGSSGTEVKELQKKLKTLGYYTGPIDGGYGKGTEKAVKAYQKAHKLQQLGNVGPGTRAALNK